MKKVLLGLATGLIMTAFMGMTAFAAEATMSDGTVFDAAFYAASYPDVVAVYGTNADSLYQHYTTYGKTEGRKATAGTTVSGAAATASTEDAKLYPIRVTRGAPNTAEGYLADTISLNRAEHGSYVVYYNGYEETIDRECTILFWDKDLAASAQRRAEELAIRYDHTRPNDSDFDAVMPEWARKSRHLETIMRDCDTPQAVFDAWNNSGKIEVKATVYNKDVNVIGIGHAVVNGRHFWVAHYAYNGFVEI